MERSPRLGPLIALLAGYLILAAPMAIYIWHQLSEVLMARIDPFPVAVAAGLLVVFVILAFLLARQIARLSQEESDA